MTLDLSRYNGFDWDAGNLCKSATKHRVTPQEAEEVFLNQPLLVAQDPKHSHAEPRWHALGQTNQGRWLLVAFTTRGDKLRIVSVRPMSRKERAVYAKAQI
jgi:uncharacterized DUF497 family protein